MKEDGRNYQSMSSLAGKKNTESYMGSSGSGVIEKGEKETMHQFVGSHENHTAGSMSAHHKSSSTKSPYKGRS